MPTKAEFTAELQARIAERKRIKAQAEADARTAEAYDEWRARTAFIDYLHSKTYRGHAQHIPRNYQC